MKSADEIRIESEAYHNRQKLGKGDSPMKNTDDNTINNFKITCNVCGLKIEPVRIKVDPIHVSDYLRDKLEFMIAIPPCPNCIKKAIERGESKGYRAGVKHTQQRHAAEL